jgi:hypothetical protein
MLGAAFENFIEKSPISVMARGLMERLLNPEKVNEWFEANAELQYTRELLFSTMLGMMTDVVVGTHKSIHSAFQATKDEMGVSVQAVYNKLNGIEINTSAELVRSAAREASAIIKEMGGTRPALLPGLNIKILDGNCIKASEHRIFELRSIAAGALPGKSLVVFDPSLRLPVDVFPCEDGHAQERSLLGDVLNSVSDLDAWIADRNFCTMGFLCGIAERKAIFVIREHKNLPFVKLTPLKRTGRVEGGQVYEQIIEVTDETGKKWKFRRIRAVLNKPTRDGDRRINIITNLSKRKAKAATVADLYRKRWTIETAFQELTEHFNSEINTLGYPPAALFAFCVALVAYIVLSTIKGALIAVHGVDKIDNEFSGYYLAEELSITYKGMLIAIPTAEWVVFRHLSFLKFCKLMLMLTKNVKLSRFKKHTRGPKKPQPKRVKDPKHPHVSTAKLIAARER